MKDITAIILTLNEEKNIDKCISSIKKLVKRIVVIDSGSNDDTVKIAKELGADVYYNKFINHSIQFNWGLDNSNIDTEWILRLDADEFFNEKINDEIEKKIEENKESSGFIVKFETFFLNKKLRFGGVYPFKKLILFKYGLGRVEDREMDERVILSLGSTSTIKTPAQHHDFKDIETFVKKHLWYAKKEVKSYSLNDSNNTNGDLGDKGIKSTRKKRKIYYRFPKFFRANLLFIYRYIFRLGFLDGRAGLVYHFLSTYFYRFLVDSYIYEELAINKGNK